MTGAVAGAQRQGDAFERDPGSRVGERAGSRAIPGSPTDVQRVTAAGLRKEAR